MDIPKAQIAAAQTTEPPAAKTEQLGFTAAVWAAIVQFFTGVGVDIRTFYHGFLKFFGIEQ